MSTLSFAVPSSPEFVSILQAEEKKIDLQIRALSQRKESLNRFRSGYVTTKPIVVAIDGSKKKPSKKSKAPQPYSTMEMARRVIVNADRELKLQEVKDRIRGTFGVAPAKSLDQMLYKRAHARKGFYRLTNGSYGLSDWRKRPKAVTTNEKDRPKAA